MLQRAQVKARALVAEAGIPVPGMMDLVLCTAAAKAQAISMLTSGKPAAAPAAVAATAAKVQEEKEEKKDEGDTAAGLGALFG
jgi:ribosomal protein L12E/L44/L45/RPP1/RPP2